MKKQVYLAALETLELSLRLLLQRLGASIGRLLGLHLHMARESDFDDSRNIYYGICENRS